MCKMIRCGLNKVIISIMVFSGPTSSGKLICIQISDIVIPVKKKWGSEVLILIKEIVDINLTEITHIASKYSSLLLIYKVWTE